MTPTTDQRKDRDPKPGSKPDTKDDLKSLPMPELQSKLGSSPDGLSQAEAQKRLTQYGPNEIEEKKTNLLLKLLTYFWGPIPWMIEAAVILSGVVQHWPDFFIILLLLISNAGVGFWEEREAGNAIAALKAKLAIKARVKRDGKWINPPARELVPGDVIRLRLGDIVPADARLLDGDPVEVDQSALTGESLPAERKPGEAVFSGSIIRQGEIGAMVYATGGKTYFGKTASLVQEAHTVSHFQKAVLKIGNYLIILAVALVAVIIAVATLRGDPVLATLQFALVLTVAAIPVAMPTVLSVTMAVGARLLARKEAIVSRLVAIEELAGVDVLCADKTGTLTQNKLTLGDPFSVADVSAEQVILYGALASRADNNDTIDLAVLNGLKDKKALDGYQAVHFQPFDPVHKRTEATVKAPDGKTFKVTKGAPQVILELAANAAQVKPAVDTAVNEFAARGFRSLGVARAEGDGPWQFAGVLPLFDPPRDDAKATIATARKMGVKIKMVTGDALAIAKETAQKLDMGPDILDAAGLGDSKKQEASEVADSIENADGFAQVFPEHKFHIVDVLQKRGHIVGMTGDGVNDAPALKKADCGIAVSDATDAARAAAAIVLMTPGLSVIIDAIKESRRIFQRMNSYAIYRIAETLRVLLFMTLAILIFNFYPLTAVMIVILALLNDGAILSIAYDNVHYKDEPEAWNMRMVLGIATVLGVVGPIAAFGLFFLGDRVYHLDHPHLQTMMYLMLSVAGHLTVFQTRTRGPFWSIRPARILWTAVLGTQIVATLIAVYGLFMTPLGWGWAAFVWGYALVWFLVTDPVKLLAYQVLDPVKAGTKPGSKGEDRAEANVKSMPDTKADAKREVKPESKTKAKPDATDESKPEAKPAGAAKDHPTNGLTSDEARRLLAKFGPNTMPDTSVHPLRMALEKLWAPVPWMLEAAVVLELVLGKYVEAAIIAGLLVFNAALGLFQESGAQATLAALKSRLALSASARRDGAWTIVPAAELVPGDVVMLSLGGVVAADMHITGGEVLLDQSMLTGESVPIEAGAGVQTFAGALVRRGEAVAEVTATGVRTKFGRTAELVRTAHVVSSQQKTVLRVVRNLAAFNGVVIVALVAYAYLLKMPLAEIIPLVLTAVLASIPVALPATFTLAAALGARALAKLGVLPTRLSAVDEAGTTDVLCTDKTGTLTQNALTVTTVHPMPGFDEAHVLALAALASADGGQDPVDAAIRAAASSKGVSDAPTLVKFEAFDPAKKTAEASATDSTGATQRIVKGAFAVVSGLAQQSPTATAAANELEGQGFRVLAVAAGPPAAMKLAGLIALSDPPRSDSAALVTELHELGLRTVMVTGDAPATAAIVARAVGLDGAICPPGPIPDNVRPEQFAVFAGVLPEDKYKLVKAFQKGNYTVGMCGDGANDAPALRQAQIGIAVSTATDVAKSAAGMVLTEPGLAGIVAAVKEGRTTFQRILTYTLNVIVKKIVTVLFLVAGLIMTGHAILTPLLMVIVMITGDFLSMSLTTDKVRPSPMPNAWRIGSLTIAGVIMGVCLLAFCTGVLAIGRFGMNLGIEALRTLGFVVLVFGSQATIYGIRERQHLWDTRPSLWLVVSSVADIVIASTLAVGGIAMTSLPALVVAGTLAAAAAFAFVLDLVKVPVFARLGIADRPHDSPSTHATRGIAKTAGIPLTEPGAAQLKASDSKPDAKAGPQPEARAEPKPDAKAPTDLTPQIAKRSYELYEERGREDGRAVQDWENAEREIRKAEAKAKPEPEGKTEPKPEAEAKTPSDLTPQLVARVHQLYRDLGRKGVQVVEELDETEREQRKDEPDE